MQTDRFFYAVTKIQMCYPEQCITVPSSLILLNIPKCSKHT